MGDHEHLVKVYPIRLESPVILSGKRYQISFVRGKTKAKAPAPILSTEACFLQLNSLGCFSQAVIHFKKSSKGFQPKMISFEFLDCSTDPQGLKLGEAEIDIAALLGSKNGCNIETSHQFRMCGYGATLVVRIVIQRLLNGKAVDDEEVMHSSTAAPISEAPTSSTVFYLPREVAMDALTKTEDLARRMSVNMRVPGQSTTLSGLLDLSQQVIDVNLRQIPDRTLMNRETIEREALRYDSNFTDADPIATERHLTHMLSQARARLAALRQSEDLEESEAKQRVQSLAAGVPTSMEMERDPPLPVLLLVNQFTKARGHQPSTPPPPPILPSVVQLPPTSARPPPSLTVAPDVPKVAPPPSIPGTQSMQNLFGGGTDSAVAPQRAPVPQTDLAPNLFESPNALPPPAQNELQNSDGPSMFATPPRGAAPPSVAARSDGLSAGMFGAKEPSLQVGPAPPGNSEINFGRSSSSYSNGSFRMDAAPKESGFTNYFNDNTASRGFGNEGGSFGAPPAHVGMGGHTVTANSFEPSSNARRDEIGAHLSKGSNPFADENRDDDW